MELREIRRLALESVVADVFRRDFGENRRAAFAALLSYNVFGHDFKPDLDAGAGKARALEDTARATLHGARARRDAKHGVRRTDRAVDVHDTDVAKPPVGPAAEKDEPLALFVVHDVRVGAGRAGRACRWC